MIEKNLITNFYNVTYQRIKNEGTPWSKFILPNTDRVTKQKIKTELLNHPNIHEIRDQLADPKLGIPSLDHKPADFRVYNSYFWVLRFFADIGIYAEDLMIEKLIHRLQLQQDEDGEIIINHHKKRKQVIKLICMTAHLIYCLINIGYLNSITVERALQFIFSSQRHDGGWHCSRSKFPGEARQHDPSCYTATIYVLRVLGLLLPKYQSITQPALKFISENLFRHQTNCPYQPDTNLNIDKLRYPPHFSALDALNLTDSLSHFPSFFHTNDSHLLFENILERWDGRHFLCSEKRIPGWSEFDFAHNRNESDWITAMVLRAIDRVYSF